MNAHMRFEVEVEGESLVAKITFVRFLASVCPLVCGKMVFPSKSLGAVSAAIRFLASVRSPMGGHGALLREAFPAQVACM